jgi:catechol 2,3-dioxygenase-like lactoylglutathione lyase family enzyme
MISLNGLLSSDRMTGMTSRNIHSEDIFNSSSHKPWKNFHFESPSKPSMIKAHFILYVQDQARSTRFYSRTLGLEPSLNVPGMTEFVLSKDCILGLMPQAGIRKLLGERLPDPSAGDGIPRAELYLLVEQPQAYHQRALASGGTELSAFAPRNWGHSAAYSLAPDGHVLAFAEPAMK